jgi:hypothetical protein
MVTRFGMSEKLGPLSLGQHDGQVFLGRDFHAQPGYSDEIAFQIDKEIRRIVDESYDSAEDLLMRNRKLLEKLSSDLNEHETVDASASSKSTPQPQSFWRHAAACPRHRPGRLPACCVLAGLRSLSWKGKTEALKGPGCRQHARPGYTFRTMFYTPLPKTCAIFTEAGQKL